MSTDKIRVLYVGDKHAFKDLTDTHFEHEDSPFTVETTTSAERGVQLVTDSPPDCIVSDYDTADTDGISFLRRVREVHSNLPFILYPDEERESVASDALSAGVSDYLEAGVGSDQLELLAHRIKRVVRARRDAQRVARQNEMRNLTESAGNTGGWELDLASNTVYLTERARQLIGRPEDAVYSLEDAMEMCHPEDRQSIRGALDQATETGKVTGGTWRIQTLDGDERVLDVTITPATADGEVTTLQGAIRDVTEQKESKQRLERHKQALHELHEAIQEYYPPSDSAEIAEFLVRILSGAFEFSYIGVKQFDEEENCLQSAARSVALTAESDTIRPVNPGPNPIWGAYEQGEPRTFDVGQHAPVLDGIGPPVDQGVAFPVGDFGVIVVCVPEDDRIDDEARDFLKVVTSNAESAFQRLRAAETHADVAAELSTKQAKVGELTTVTATLQQLHKELAISETQESLDKSVCDNITQTDQIDFAWVGRPDGVETNLQPVTWAGKESGYLNKISLDSSDEPLPAHRVVDGHEQCLITDIGSHATETDWGKYALTAGFRSVISVPLVYDGVLYGVLSAYSTEEGVFDQTYGDLVTNAGSLLVSYGRTLANRYEGTPQKFTILEFELSDPAYPFHRLAATTDCRIRVDTVVETTETEIQLLVSVLDGDPKTVFDQASSVAAITDVDWFGDDAEQLSVSVQRPFLASILGKHGAVLFEAISDSGVTNFRVKLPIDTPKRPVLDSLMSEYAEIAPVAQRRRTDPDSLDTPQVDEILTDRQHEVLRAAFHGGYYETPKEVTGNDIAANFDISNTAVYDHLRASHRNILGAVLKDDDEYR